MKLMQSKTLAILTLMAYLYLGVFALLAMSGHNHHSPMNNCPYMIGQTSVCAMDTFEHLTAWQAITLTVLSLAFVLSLVVLVYFFIRTFPSSSPPLLRQFSYYKKIQFEPIFNKIEQAFACGILNPKPY